MSTVREANRVRHLGPVPVMALGPGLGSFFGISFLACIPPGRVVPDAGLYRPWLQFFPGFEWLTSGSIIVGFVWTQVYAWYTAPVFGSLFNFFAARSN